MDIEPTMFSKRECPICGNTEVKLMFTQNFANIQGISFLNGYDVVSCKQCNFVYASNIPEQAAFDEYYINSNKYEHETEQSDTITGKDEHIIKEIVHFGIDKTTSIVDIGCARSEILRSLQKLGFSNLTGIDPSAKNIEYLKSKGINGIHTTVKDIDTSKQYEIVLFIGVLEHIQDLYKTLNVLYALTKNNGLLIVQVPSMEMPMSGEFPYQEFSREHINFFTTVSLSNLMTKYGFHTVLSKRLGSGMGTGLVGIYRKGSNSVQTDTSGMQRIQSYMDKSKKYEDAIYTNLSRYSDTPVIVWGLGTFTQRLLARNVLKNIVVMVDSNPQYVGKKYNNINIIPPNEIQNYKESVLLAVSARYLDAIIHTIRDELKLGNEIINPHSGFTFEY